MIRLYIMLFVDYHIDFMGWTTSWRNAKKHLEKHKGYGTVVRLTIRDGEIVEDECWTWGEWKERE